MGATVVENIPDWPDDETESDNHKTNLPYCKRCLSKQNIRWKKKGKKEKKKKE